MAYGQFMGGMAGIPAGMIGGPMTNQTGQYATPPQVPGVYLQGQSTVTVSNPAVQNQAASATNAGPDSLRRSMVKTAQRNIKVGQQAVVEGVEKAGQVVQNNALYPRAALLGGVIAPTLQGMGEIAEGDIGEGAGRILGGGTGAFAGGKLGGAAISALTKSSNPLLKLGGIAIGSLAGGNIAGSIGAGLGGFAEDKVGGVTGRGESRGAQRKRSKQDTAVAAENLTTMTNAYMNPMVQNNIQLSEAFMNQRLTELQKTLPIINEMKNQDLVRQQALNASQAANYMAMGTVATAGKLATGAQEQAGMNFRQAITTNPYAGNVLQAPNINFG